MVRLSNLLHIEVSIISLQRTGCSFGDKYTPQLCSTHCQLTRKIGKLQDPPLLAVSRHPDKNPDRVNDAKVQFQKVTAAYERLTTEGALPDENSDEDDDFGWDYGEEAYYQAEDLFCNLW